MNGPPLPPPCLKPPKLRTDVGDSPMAMPSAVGLLTLSAAAPSGVGMILGLTSGLLACPWVCAAACSLGCPWVVLGFQLAEGNAPGVRGPAALGPGPTTGPIGTVRAHGWSNGSARKPKPDDTEMLLSGIWMVAACVPWPLANQNASASVLVARKRWIASVPLTWVLSSAHSTRPTPVGLPSMVKVRS